MCDVNNSGRSSVSNGKSIDVEIIDGRHDVVVWLMLEVVFNHTIVRETTHCTSIDSQLFEDLASLSFSDTIADNFTIYSSREDFALKGSGIIHQHSRAGRHPPYTIVKDMVSTIAVEDLKKNILFDIKHSYFASEESVLHDLRLLLQSSMKEMDRGWFIQGDGYVPKLTNAGYRLWKAFQKKDEDSD